MIKDYTPPQDLLAGRVVLVTGAGAGIGRQASLSFAEHGATVVLLGRTEKRLEAVYDEIEQRGGPQPALFPMDLARTTAEDLQRFAAALDKEFGRLDGLLHNAAELGLLTPLARYPDPVWDKLMQVNLHAPFRLTRACLDLLSRSPGASVIFTTSKVARQGRAYWGAYGIAGAAVENMMRIWADELESTNIRVNSLDPGPVRTAMRAIAFPGEVPESRPEPAAVMPAYLYLMGPDSRGVTGQAFSAQDG